jgi:hypothetical protein
VVGRTGELKLGRDRPGVALAGSASDSVESVAAGEGVGGAVGRLASELLNMLRLSS